MNEKNYVPSISEKITFSEKMIKTSNTVIEKKPNVRIIHDSMFDLAYVKNKEEKKVSLHNFANNYSPGHYKISSTGKIYFPSNTQEEQLLRSCIKANKLILSEHLYPICGEKDDEVKAILSQNVLFCKDTVRGYRLKPKYHYRSDVITCPALCKPPITNDEYLYEKDKELMLKRMILCLYLSKDSDVFITGLWGCGSFSHTPKLIAKVLKEALSMVSECASEIIFAITIDDKTKQKNTIPEFKDILKDYLI